METTQAKNGTAKAKKAVGKTEEKIEEQVTDTAQALEQGMTHARDIVEDLRDRAELAFHERPYLLPVATAAAGFGVGVLVGSKLTRALAIAAAGALLSDTVRGQVLRLSREWLNDIGAKMDEAKEAEDVEGAHDHHPGDASVT